MKLYNSVFLCLGLLLTTLTSIGQVCLKEDFYLLQDNCTSMINKFAFSNSVDVKPGMFKYGGEKIEYKYLLTKGSTYLITLCDKGMSQSPLVVEVFDRNKNLIASSYHSDTDKHYRKIYIPCKATGFYYLRYHFAGANPSCGVSVMGVQNSAIKQLK